MTVAEFLKKEGILGFAALPLDKCKITKERLISDAPEDSFAIMTYIPYPVTTSGLFAAFSVIPDYHIFFSRLEKKLSALFEEKYENLYMKVFADHSPIDERLAACNAGLGVMGDNGLFISNNHGSFVFIGEIICSLSEKELSEEGVPICFEPVRECIHCGACKNACPSGAVSGEKNLCISHITQKKGNLSDTEKDIIKESGYVWGCDICALTCPMNKKTETATHHPFFTDGIISPKTFADIDAMSDEEYAKYPFSWRKKELLKRNFEILGK